MNPLKTSAGTLRKWLTLMAVTVVLAAQAQYVAGDYGSWASGSWNTLATWRVYNGTNWATSPVATAPPNSTSRVFIRTGTTVTTPFGFSYFCLDLFVEAGAKLYSNHTVVNQNVYVYIYGTTWICDGEIGNGATLDNISFNVEGVNVSLSGTGQFAAARIRKFQTVNTTTNFTISMNITLRFPTGSTTMIYNGANGASNFHVTIGAGSTVTLVGAGTGNLAMDGTAGADTGALGGSYTVNGTLIVPGILYLTTNNANTAQQCRFTINNGGVVRAAQISAPPSGTGLHVLTINAGGTLDVTGGPLAWSPYSPVNNTYTLAANSTVIYSALGAQNVPNITGGYGNLRITGSGAKSLIASTLVKGNVVIDNLSGSPELDVTTSNQPLAVRGNWTNYNATGFNERAGRVTFENTLAQTINTTGGERFYDWRFSKTGATPFITMASNVEVANTLEFFTTTNVLDLGGYELGLLNSAATAISVPSGSFGVNRSMRSELQSNASRVRWDIGTTTGAHVVPFSTSADYIPFTFNLVSGNAGSVTMATYGTPQNNLAWPVTPTAVTNLTSSVTGLDNADATVDRFWQVDVTGTPTASLTFTYAPSELPIAPWDDPVSLRAQRWNSATQAWELQVEGSSAANYATTDVTVTSFGPFTLTPIISPLPIELLSFHAQPTGKEVTLEWVTASERNNDYFTVLRSADGFRFEPILHVEGAGNSTTAIRYADVDEQPLQGLSYYKLRQTDMDGTTSESQVVAVRFSASKGGSLVAWPNPAESELNLAGFGGTNAEVRLMDAAGRVVLLERTTSDTQRLVLPLYGLARGSYTVQVLGDGGLNSLPVVLH